MNMNKYERLNQQKKYRSEKSFSGKKRVAAYCRVSTEKEEQAQSFESQCDFFRCYIEQKKEWEFYKVFADEGISGTSTKKREQFNQMIAEAKQRKFDLLITKEISRFARNTLDSIYYTRELRKVGVGVLFLNDGINTLDGRSMLGYDVRNGKMYVNEEGAEVVRKIFYKFVEERKSTHTIARELLEEGIYPMRSKKWRNTVILRILQNEKYCGDLVQKKTFTPDYLSHEKKYNRGEEEFVIIKNHHEPIISREMFEKAEKIFSRNKAQKDSENT